MKILAIIFGAIVIFGCVVGVANVFNQAQANEPSAYDIRCWADDGYLVFKEKIIGNVYAEGNGVGYSGYIIVEDGKHIIRIRANCLIKEMLRD